MSMVAGLQGEARTRAALQPAAVLAVRFGVIVVAPVALIGRGRAIAKVPAPSVAT
jgi:hypothetical protein